MDIPAEPRKVGRREQAVIDAFGKDNDQWKWTSYEQYSPDQTLIGGIYMLVCPVCFCLAVPGEEDGSTDWATAHRQWHIDLARALDQR